MDNYRQFIRLGFLVVVNIAIQFLFNWYVIVHFGASKESDIFFGTLALPTFVLQVLSGSLSYVLIPIFSKLGNKGLKKSTTTFFVSVGILFTVLALILFVTAQWWVSLVLPGFTGSNYQLATSLSRIQLLGMIFSAQLSVLWASYSAKEEFFKVEITTIISNVSAFAFFYLSLKYYGIYTAAWVTVLKVLLQIFLLSGKLDTFKFKSFHHIEFIAIWRKLRPLIAGSFYYKTDSLLDKFLSSKGAIGDLTLLSLTQLIYSSGNSLLIKTMVNTMVPAMARVDNDKKAVNQILKKRLLIMTWISFIAFIFLIFLGRGTLELIFKYKSVSNENIQTLETLMLLMFGYFVGGVLGSITSSTFYALGDTATPTKVGIILFSIYIPIKILVFHLFSINGLAISISLYYLVSFVIQYYLLKKKISQEREYL